MLAFDAVYRMSSLQQNLPLESTNLFRKWTLTIIHCTAEMVTVAWETLLLPGDC